MFDVFMYSNENSFALCADVIYLCKTTNARNLENNEYRNVFR